MALFTLSVETAWNLAYFVLTAYTVEITDNHKLGTSTVGLTAQHRTKMFFD
jgi:hypothetical protein